MRTIVVLAWLLAALNIVPVAAAEVSPQGALYSAVILTSDYRFNGASSSNGNPARQGYVHWWRPDGYYLGLFATSVDFDDPNDTALEIDIYAGRNFEFDRTEFKLEAMYTTFDDDVPGPTYDFVQAKARVARRFGATTWATAIAWSPEAPYRGGRSTQYRVEYQRPLADWIAVDALFGASHVTRRVDRRYWELGVGFAWKAWSLGIRYADTDATFADCGYTNWCESTLLAKVQFALPALFW